MKFISHTSNLLKYMLLSVTILISCKSKEEVPQSPQVQFPSPMEETVRAHDRIEHREYPGISIKISNVLSKPVELYIPNKQIDLKYSKLLIHFHGSAFVVKNAVYNSDNNLILAVINQGHGSSAYENEFVNPSIYTELLNAITDTVSIKTNRKVSFKKVYFTSFSAGYGAVREIIKTHSSKVNGILLLDGLHTDYIPDGKVLAEGGKLNTDKLQDFLKYAKSAVNKRTKFMISHSAIFPGTYASTTETADWLINTLGLKSTPVLKWGPVGMQQISEVEKGNLKIWGFAGNTARDHVDHYHALPKFLHQFLCD